MSSSVGSAPDQIKPPLLLESPKNQKMTHHHHQATDSLVNLLTKANHDLTLVQFKLEREFQQIYPDNANPVKLVNRIKKLQEDLVILKDQTQELLVAKQDLIDKAKTTLIGNRNLIQRMEVSMGMDVTSDAEDPAFANLNQIIDEWTTQVRSRTGEERHESESENLNRLFFSTIVENG